MDEPGEMKNESAATRAEAGTAGGHAGQGQAGPDHPGDSAELRRDLDAVLASKDLAFADDLDEAFREDLRASWRQLARARGGILSGADIHDTVASYVRIGLVRKLSVAARDPHDSPAQGSSLRRTIPEEARTRMEDGASKRPTGPYGQAPAIAWLAAEPSPNGSARPIPGQLYGCFSNEFGETTFESQDAAGSIRILSVARVDSRFAKLVALLAKNHVALVLAGTPDADGLEVWDMQAVEELPEGDSLRTMPANLLETMLARLRVLPKPGDAPQAAPRRAPEARPRRLLTNLEEVTDYLSCMEDALPPSIRTWAWQNLETARNEKVSKEERGHAARSLSIVLSIQWNRPPFHRVDPARARAILDQQLFGLDSVKQRVIETIIQINRTRTLPLYGLLLAGPAGVGKSQIAYAAARILNLPWASLDMSTIRDLAALTGSDRVYSNAKPGRVMEALEHAGSANMVLVINELDKADEGGPKGSSADALLTLFDNLGFTDNYIECSIPTDGIYPIATANDLSKIDGPLLSRFELIEIPDYAPEEKRVILRDYSLPKILDHMGLRGEEFSLTDAAFDCVIERYRDESGCRSLEKAAEHLAAHALFLLESDPSLGHITFDAADVQRVLDT